MTHLRKFSLFIFWIILAAGCSKTNSDLPIACMHLSHHYCLTNTSYSRLNSGYPDAKSIMYFFDLDGKQITGIPFNAIDTYAFVYTENGVTYKPDNIYVSRFEH